MCRTATVEEGRAGGETFREEEEAGSDVDGDEEANDAEVGALEEEGTAAAADWDGDDEPGLLRGVGVAPADAVKMAKRMGREREREREREKKEPSKNGSRANEKMESTFRASKEKTVFFFSPGRKKTTIKVTKMQERWE